MAKMQAPESLGGESVYLAHEAANNGKYLMRVIDAHEDGRPTKDGIEPINGFSAECEVVGGVNDGKKFNLTLYNGKLTAKDGGKMAIQKQFAFLVATDVCTPSQLGTEFEYDPVSSVNSFFVVELELGNETGDGKRYLDLKYSNIYHVDDPRGKLKFDPAQQAKLATIAAANRHTAEYFASLAAPRKQVEKSKADKPLDLDDL